MRYFKSVQPRTRRHNVPLNLIASKHGGAQEIRNPKIAEAKRSAFITGKELSTSNR